jgi:L-gulonolactone oxidase
MLTKSLQVNVEKRYVVAEGGITLESLHEQLAAHGLAMRNVGSISDQTLAGVVATATHGSGLQYGVLSTDVLSLTLLLADGSRVQCSRQEKPDLFLASICGLGSTGLILNIRMEVEPLFRLKEIQESKSFDYVVANIDATVSSAEHVRLWWFPASDTIRISSMNRTTDVCCIQACLLQLLTFPLQPKQPAGSWLWHSLLGFHVVQFLLFVGRFFLFMNTWTSRFACWLVSDDTVAVDDGYRIFNVDCRVRSSFSIHPI